MKTRKLLALVLAIAMIATVFVVPSAAVAPGAACEILGLLEGDGEGVTAEYLAKGTMRVQGLLITLRARGLEGEALAFTGTDTFSDAGDVAEFWAPILAYAYANPDLGWIGDGDGTFRPADIMTGAELAKVMLALLGYVQGEDFEWDDIATFAESKGVTVPEGEATNDDLAGSLVEALALETKEGGTLVDAMIADGVVTEEAALEAEVKETEPAVTTAFAVEVAGAKKVKAIFAEAQDIDTAVITLKKGAVGQAITPKWNDAKKEVTLTKAIAFTKGDYTLTINGEAVDFTIEADETATELVVGASTVYLKAGPQDIKLHLLNQYGEQMQWTAGQVVFGASLGEMVEKDSKTATLKLPDDGGDPAKVTVKAGVTSTIFAYYSPKNFTVNATITVVENQKLSSIVFTGPIALGDASKKLTRLTEKTDGNTLACKALDQYGNKLKLDAYVQGTDYQLVVAGGTVVVGADKLTLNGADLAAGTFTIRAIVMASGSVSEMYTETVYAKPKVASFDIAVPETIYADEKAAFTIEATDQYGKAIKVADPSGWAITPLSTTVKVVDGSREDAENKITVKFNTKGTADLYFQTGALTVVKPISVQAKKVVSSIASIPLSTEALLLTKTIAIDKQKVVINDQYGNKLLEGKNLGAEWKWELRRLADTLPYGLATDTDKATIFVIDNPNLKIAAQKAGTEQLRLTLYTGGDYGQTELDTYKEYVYDFNLSAVAASAVVAYELKIADTMYANNPRKADHDVKVALIGKTANGTTVTLTDTAALPNIVAQYTITGTIVKIDEDNSKLVLVDPAKPLAKDTRVVTVKAWDNKGQVVATKDVTLASAVPAVTTLAIKYDNPNVILTAKDQYGVAIGAPAGKFFSSDTKILTVDADGKVTKVKAGTAMVRFVSNDGVWTREVEVTVK